jgi:hypothetical protein
MSGVTGCWHIVPITLHGEDRLTDCNRVTVKHADGRDSGYCPEHLAAGLETTKDSPYKPAPCAIPCSVCGTQCTYETLGIRCEREAGHPVAADGTGHTANAATVLAAMAKPPPPPDEGPFPETVVHMHLDGTSRKYIPVDGVELKELLEAARSRALDEAAEAFGVLRWLCLDHGGEEVARIRDILYAVRDRRRPT